MCWAAGAPPGGWHWLAQSRPSGLVRRLGVHPTHSRAAFAPRQGPCNSLRFGRKPSRRSCRGRCLDGRFRQLSSSLWFPQPSGRSARRPAIRGLTACHPSTSASEACQRSLGGRCCQQAVRLPFGSVPVPRASHRLSWSHGLARSYFCSAGSSISSSSGCFGSQRRIQCQTSTRICCRENFISRCGGLPGPASGGSFASPSPTPSSSPVACPAGQLAVPSPIYTAFRCQPVGSNTSISAVSASSECGPRSVSVLVSQSFTSGCESSSRFQIRCSSSSDRLCLSPAVFAWSTPTPTPAPSRRPSSDDDDGDWLGGVIPVLFIVFFIGVCVFVRRSGGTNGVIAMLRNRSNGSGSAAAVVSRPNPAVTTVAPQPSSTANLASATSVKPGAHSGYPFSSVSAPASAALPGMPSAAPAHHPSSSSGPSPGYPGAGPSPGYPGAGPSPGYPGAGPSPGYPGAGPSPGYPGAGPSPGYPGAPHSTFPPQGSPGAPPPPQASGYPGSSAPSYNAETPASGYEL